MSDVVITSLDLIIQQGSVQDVHNYTDVQSAHKLHDLVQGWKKALSLALSLSFTQLSGRTVGHETAETALESVR